MKTTRLRMLLAMVALLTTAVALPGPSGVAPSSSQTIGLGLLTIGNAQIADAAVSIFKTGAASTLTDLMWARGLVTTANGTGTATLDITSVDGTAVCSMNIDCTTLTSVAQGSTTCSVALSANTVYQLRNKAQCASGGTEYMNVTIRTTTP